MVKGRSFHLVPENRLQLVMNTVMYQQIMNEVKKIVMRTTHRSCERNLCTCIVITD